MKTLIIGANTEGIGDAIAKRIRARQDASVYTPFLHMLDVTSMGSIEEYIATNGPFDEIVYTAGVPMLRWAQDLSPATLTNVFAVNTHGAILVAGAHRDLYPDAAVRYAVVVSDAAHTPMRGSIAYTASKAALEMVVKNLARELAPLWTVVGVSPGVVEGTQMTAQLARDIPGFRGWTPDQAAEYEGVPPIGRRITKQEVAETLWFALTGPQALNGSIITLNGGK